ncbi:cytochrome P450 [Colletotrichum lupini]|nr:cytochrome P450 [Colletotrichum lupini]
MNHSNQSNPLSWALAYFSNVSRQPGASKPEYMFAILTFSIFLWISITTASRGKRPLINPRRWFDISGKKRKIEYIPNCAKYIELGLKLFQGRPYRMATDMGEILILPATWAHEIRNDPNLSLNEVLKADFHVGYPGFEPFEVGFADDGLLLAVTRKHLTKHADVLNQPLSAEASFIIDKTFGAPHEWCEFALKPLLVDIIAQCSACMFIGPDHCRDEAWLKITKKYTLDCLRASEALRLWPKVLRGTAQKYLGSCKKLRNHIAEARRIIHPIIEKRRALHQKHGGKLPPSELPNLVDWFEEEADGRPYDLAVFQVLISLASIHATSDLINEALLCLARDPQLVDDVREEIAKVVPHHGFSKVGLYNLKLLDSVIKESQRLKVDPVFMNRIATGRVKLPDGSTVLKGQRLSVSGDVMRNDKLYQNPSEFDGYRYLRLRQQPGNESQFQLTSTSPTDLSWGLGKHACPGRFFVANEVKLLLIHILMKYDLKLPEEYTPQKRCYGINVSSDPESRILLRKHTPYIDIDSL